MNKRGPYMTRVAGCYLTEREARRVRSELSKHRVPYALEFIATDLYGLRVLTSHHCIAVTIVRALGATVGV
jgi:hypothetical protein